MADFDALKQYDPQFKDLMNSYDGMEVMDDEDAIYEKLIESIHVRLKGVEAVIKATAGTPATTTGTGSTRSSSASPSYFLSGDVTPTQMTDLARVE